MLTVTLDEALAVVPVVAILRGLDSEESVALAHAAISGGLRAIEITMDSPGAAETIRQLVASAPSGVAIGAGTVVGETDLHAAVSSGAAFLFAPHLDEQLVKIATAQAIPMIPGVSTPTELHLALTAGAPKVKLFPADALGTTYLKALRGPYPAVSIIASGGITIDAIPQWLASGAAAVGLGLSALSNELGEMKERAAAAVAAARRASD